MVWISKKDDVDENDYVNDYDIDDDVDAQCVAGDYVILLFCVLFMCACVFGFGVVVS